MGKESKGLFNTISAVLIIFFILLFLGSGIGKILNFNAFRAAVEEYAIVPYSLIFEVSLFIIVIELLAALLLIVSSTRFIGSLISALLLLIFISAVAINLGRGREIDCGCFLFGLNPGSSSTLASLVGLGDISINTIIRNLIFLGFIGVVIVNEWKFKFSLVKSAFEKRFVFYPLFIIFFLIVVIKGFVVSEDYNSVNVFQKYRGKIAAFEGSHEGHDHPVSGDEAGENGNSITWYDDFYYALYLARERDKKVFLVNFVNREGAHC